MPMYPGLQVADPSSPKPGLDLVRICESICEIFKNKWKIKSGFCCIGILQQSLQTYPLMQLKHEDTQIPTTSVHFGKAWINILRLWYLTVWAVLGGCAENSSAVRDIWVIYLCFISKYKKWKVQKDWLQLIIIFCTEAIWTKFLTKQM